MSYQRGCPARDARWELHLDLVQSGKSRSQTREHNARADSPPTNNSGFGWIRNGAPSHLAVFSPPGNQSQRLANISLGGIRHRADDPHANIGAQEVSSTPASVRHAIALLAIDCSRRHGHQNIDLIGQVRRRAASVALHQDDSHQILGGNGTARRANACTWSRSSSLIARKA